MKTRSQFQLNEKGTYELVGVDNKGRHGNFSICPTLSVNCFVFCDIIVSNYIHFDGMIWLL
jgi:hypothetical protein